MFIAALFTIAKIWKQPKCPSVDERIKKMAVQNTAAAAKSLQSCLTLCDPIDGSLPGSSVPGILQARTLAWVAISFSKQHAESSLKDKTLPHLPSCCCFLGVHTLGLEQC